MSADDDPNQPANKPVLRTLAVIAAVVLAIGAPIVQALYPFGLSAAEFASDGNETLRAAGYAFSIWGLIYFGLAVYAIYHAWPGLPDSPFLRRIAWASVIAIAGCGFWIIASAFDQKIATVLIIVVSAITLSAALTASAGLAHGRETWFALWPLALLAGWLTIAASINILTVGTAAEWISDARAPAAGALGIGAVTVIAISVLARTRVFAYGLPIAWGLAAVYAAEHEHRPMVALGAAAASVIVPVAAIGWAFRRRVRVGPRQGDRAGR